MRETAEISSGGASNFGALLADLARHGARLYSRREGTEIRAALEVILSRMTKELKLQDNSPNISL
jgi:hypothetical protein